MKRFSIFWYIAILPLCLFSCLGHGDDTIVLLGEESYVQNMYEIIGDTALIPFCLENNLCLPEGFNPPDIQGEFVLSDLRCMNSVGSLPTTIDSLFFRFGGEPEIDTATGNHYYLTDAGQHHMVVACDYKVDDMLLHFDAITVMGDGKDFSAFFAYDTLVVINMPGDPTTYRFNITQGVLLTGQMSTDHQTIDSTRVLLFNKKVKPLTALPEHPYVELPQDGWKAMYKPSRAVFHEWYGNPKE